MKAIHARVRGLVQGVFFRQNCRREALALGLSGWVRNDRDGTVEVFAQGDDEAVDRLVEWLWHGPPTARVTGVESETVPLDPQVTGFVIRR